VIVNISHGLVFLVFMQVFRHSANMEMCTNHFTSQTFMAVTMLLKIQVFWDIMSRWLVYSYHSFRGGCSFTGRPRWWR